MHARHIVQASLSMTSVPNGAPAGSAISFCGTGACRARCSTASAAVVRLSVVNPKVAGTRTDSAVGHDHSASSSAFTSAAANAEMLALIAERLGDRLGEPHLSLQRLEVFGRDGVGGEHRDLTRAERDRREPGVEADRGDMMHLVRDHARRETAPAPREGRDGAASVLVVQQDAGVAAAGTLVGREQQLQAGAPRSGADG